MKIVSYLDQSSKGVSLVEVLVALLVLGVGVMGFVALQIRSVDATNTTYSRMQAMAIARDLIERVNSNHDSWPKGYDASDNKWDKTSASINSCTRTQGAGSKASCTSQQLALADVDEVKQTLATMLFNGSMSVEPNCKGAQVACVIVAWDGTSVADCDPESVTVSSPNQNANCVIVEFWPQRAILNFLPGAS